MSRPTLQALLAQAAELRAVGYTWPAIAKRVHRKARTCQQWPRRHAADWDCYYQAARLRRFEETSEEAHTRLHGLLRSEDEKVRLKAIDLWIRNGSGVYDKLGATADWAAYRLDQAELRRGGQTIERFWGRAERKVNALRAAAGQPPLTADEWEEVEGAIAEAREARRPWLPAALAAFPEAAGEPVPPSRPTTPPAAAVPSPPGGLVVAISLLLAILVVGRGGPGLPDHETAARGTGFQPVRIGRAETLPIRAAGS